MPVWLGIQASVVWVPLDFRLWRSSRISGITSFDDGLLAMMALMADVAENYSGDWAWVKVVYYF